MNHRAMRRRLDEEIDRATRTGGQLSCLLIDLDDFKLVNDRHGHQAGDAMLRAVVQALVGEFRAFDRVARYGGDEFVVILPNAEPGQRRRGGRAGRSSACTRSRAHDTVASAASRPRSASPSGSAPMSTDELLAACDAALLRAKREGKGRVTRARLAALSGARPQRRAGPPGCPTRIAGAAAGTLRDCRAVPVDPDEPGRCPCRRTASARRTPSRSAGASIEIFRLDALQQRFDVARLPFSLKVLLENLLRTEGNGSVTARDIEAPRQLGRQARSRAGRSPSAPRAC